MTREDIIKAIEEMSVLELSELVKELEDKFGVSAAASTSYLKRPVPRRSRSSRSFVRSPVLALKRPRSLSTTLEKLSKRALPRTRPRASRSSLRKSELLSSWPKQGCIDHIYNFKGCRLLTMSFFYSYYVISSD
jgi:hypothetical protein